MLTCVSWQPTLLACFSCIHLCVSPDEDPTYPAQDDASSTDSSDGIWHTHLVYILIDGHEIKNQPEFANIAFQGSPGSPRRVICKALHDVEEASTVSGKTMRECLVIWNGRIQETAETVPSGIFGFLDFGFLQF